MKKLLLAALVVWAPLTGCDVPNDDESNAQQLNVNSRYTVESVQVSGQKDWRISDGLRSELDKVVGQKFDRTTLDALAGRIRKELHVTDVSMNIKKGTAPDHVVVNFDVAKSHEQTFDLNVAKFLYDSKQGWSGSGAATTRIAGNSLTFGLVSDGDELVERFAGVRAKFERPNLGTDRMRLSFEFDAYHDQWNSATLAASDLGGIYRSREVFTPEATLLIAAPLELGFGVSFSRFQPEASAAKTESSNAVVSTLRFHQRWGSEHDVHEQDLRASYSVRSATHFFQTDSVFTRQLGEARYRFRHDHSAVDIGFLAGVINGNAPLFERFALGNATTLRGWNKFELDPIGGSRMIHGSVDCSYRFLEVFYDTGAIWDRPQDREQKQSVGVGFKAEGFQLAVAFPMRAGHAEPIFYAGRNF